MTGPDATGRYTIVPNAPVLLGPSNPAAANPSNRPTFCTLQMTILNVGRVPTVDVDVNPGVQTFRAVDATIIPAPDPGPAPGHPGPHRHLLQHRPGHRRSRGRRPSTPSPPPGRRRHPGAAGIARPPTRPPSPGSSPEGWTPRATVTFRLLQNPNADCSTGTVVSGPTVVAIDAGHGYRHHPAHRAARRRHLQLGGHLLGRRQLPPIAAPVGCNDPDERFIVAIPPQIQVEKTANPLTLPEPGGNFTYTIVVTNPSPTVPITITSLTDNVYGNLPPPAAPAPPPSAPCWR